MCFNVFGCKNARFYKWIPKQVSWHLHVDRNKAKISNMGKWRNWGQNAQFCESRKTPRLKDLSYLSFTSSLTYAWARPSPVLHKSDKHSGIISSVRSTSGTFWNHFVIYCTKFAACFKEKHFRTASQTSLNGRSSHSSEKYLVFRNGNKICLSVDVNKYLWSTVYYFKIW